MPSRMAEKKNPKGGDEKKAGPETPKGKADKKDVAVIRVSLRKKNSTFPLNK